MRGIGRKGQNVQDETTVVGKDMKLDRIGETEEFRENLRFQYSLSIVGCYSNMEISEKTIKFIQEHAKDDVTALRLKYAGKSVKMDFPIEFALLQIEARRKALKKIPSFLKAPYFVFADTLSSEQASNETVAQFHASLLRRGSSLLDLTAGLGIDAMTFALHGVEVTACEINEKKAEALENNARVMGISDRIKVVNEDSMAFVRTCNKHFDVVFADPARRSMTGNRLHALSDCQPDILGNIDSILSITDRLIIKCSPLLDLTLIRDTVEGLSHIFVVCLRGECKEVLIDIEKGKEFSGVTVLDLDKKEIISRFDCHLSPISSENFIGYADRDNPVEFNYLYEPNAGVMKTGAWSEIARQIHGIKKASKNTHIFLSDTLIEGFPGRTLRICGQADKKALKAMKGSKFNVVARNYPISAPEIEKKYSIKPGGEVYLYAFVYKDTPVCLIAEPVSKDQRVEESRNLKEELPFR